MLSSFKFWNEIKNHRLSLRKYNRDQRELVENELSIIELCLLCGSGIGFIFLIIPENRRYNTIRMPLQQCYKDNKIKETIWWCMSRRLFVVRPEVLTLMVFFCFFFCFLFSEK